MTVRIGYDFAMIRAGQRCLAGAGIQKQHSDKTAKGNGKRPPFFLLLST